MFLSYLLPVSYSLKRTWDGTWVEVPHLVPIPLRPCDPLRPSATLRLLKKTPGCLGSIGIHLLVELRKPPISEHSSILQLGPPAPEARLFSGPSNSIRNSDPSSAFLLHDCWCCFRLLQTIFNLVSNIGPFAFSVLLKVG